jgi:hypothetical protein
LAEEQYVPEVRAGMSTIGRRFAYRERVRTFGEPVRPVEMVKEGPPRSRSGSSSWRCETCAK